VLGTLWQWAKPLIIKGRQTASFANGLFALKGGDLTEEIANSGVRPHTWPINGLFGENYYEEKQIVYVPK
jgi:16S rRNA (guanine527-N7)-methyltransferase